ncbi:MAG TPA: hypothetical protein VLA49_16800 [Anaerolineales bacterium]|nr:hypothetical protein [Anaerolineales bacterium]
MLTILSCVLVLTACRAVSEFPDTISPFVPWQYTDLRALDPADSTLPEQDILAIYVREYSLMDHKQLEIRLDILSMSLRSEFDIYLAIDHAPGGVRELPLESFGLPAITELDWDTLLVIPANAPLQGIDSQGANRSDLALSVRQDPNQDTISLKFNKQALPSLKLNWQIQVFITAPYSNIVVDLVKPVSIDASPPAQAPVLFAFWNTFPAYTPAQTVRRWAGAHTGPLGGSHGLYHLLHASQRFDIPMTLLDLTAPVSLSALDYSGGIELVRELAVKGLIGLPVSISLSFGDPVSVSYAMPDWLIEHSISSIRQTALDFKLPASQFLYGIPQSGIPAGYTGIFSPFHNTQEDLDPLTTQKMGPLRVIPVPLDLPDDQATLDGLSVAVRKALIETALLTEAQNHPRGTMFLVLGGDLAHSTWGEPRRARASFEYLNAHPWVKPLDANSLLSISPGRAEQVVSPAGERSLPPAVLDQLENPTLGVLLQATWQAYHALNTPALSGSEQLVELRLKYLRQISMLLSASKWERAPAPQASCQEDLDLDGKAECILASESVYTISEIEEGSLVYLFVRTPSGVHQLVGPTSQLAVGLSEPESWDFSLSDRADPAVIPAAFDNADGPYTANIQGTSLTFNNPKTVKTISLTPNGIEMKYHSQVPTAQVIPIILDPWERFKPGWGERYTLEDVPNGIHWGLAGGLTVQFITDAPVDTDAFTVTRPRMGLVENPNFDYPAGHYLPFPLALIKLSPVTEFSVIIEALD